MDRYEDFKKIATNIARLLQASYVSFVKDKYVTIKALMDHGALQEGRLRTWWSPWKAQSFPNPSPYHPSKFKYLRIRDVCLLLDEVS